MMKRLWPYALLLLAAGCASVKPWEKQVLSQPEMRFSADGKHTPFFEHAVITTEQAEGGEGGEGGGCGCR